MHLKLQSHRPARTARIRGIVPLAVLFGMLGTLLHAAPALAAPPPNDAFAAAQPLSGTSTTASGTTVGATLEPGEPSRYTDGNGSVWYSWTAPQDLVLTVDTCGAPYIAVPQLWLGTSVASLTEVTPRAADYCDLRQPPNDYGKTNTYFVPAGTTYMISVVKSAGPNADTPFTLTLASIPAPTNDDFASAQDLGDAPNVDVDGTTATTTLEPGEPGYSVGGSAGSVWYRWTAPRRMRVWFDNCGAAFPTHVNVYTGTAVDSLKGVEENLGEPAAPFCDYTTFGARSEFLAREGTTYMIGVNSDRHQADTFHLRMREILFDGSMSQTASAKTVRKGQTVTYTVDIKNLGTIPIDPDVQLLTSKPDSLAKAVVGTKYVSLTTTKGTCRKVKYFAKHPGAFCQFGELAPGESLQIVARVRPSESLSHWYSLDYDHGADGDVDDDVPANDPSRGHTNTIVKRARR